MLLLYVHKKLLIIMCFCHNGSHMHHLYTSIFPVYKFHFLINFVSTANFNKNGVTVIIAKF